MTDDRYRLLTENEQIDLRKIRDVELWTDVLDIYTADLFNAVAVAGTSSAAVLQYLIDNRLVGRALRTPAATPKPPAGGST